MHEKLRKTQQANHQRFSNISHKTHKHIAARDSPDQFAAELWLHRHLDLQVLLPALALRGERKD
jgi:hypothetical protein